MENDDLINRSKKISNAKHTQAQKAEFLKTDYHIPLFDSLYATIKQFADTLKEGGLQYHIYLDKPEVYDNWKRMICISSQKLSCSIKYTINSCYGRSNDPFEDFEMVLQHVFTAERRNEFVEETEITEGDLNLTISDNLEPLWNGYDNKTVARAIFQWFIETMEKHYGV
jgi:hypothetical protein